jgi:hypothetical protein
MIWRSWVLRFCIRPLNGTFVPVIGVLALTLDRYNDVVRALIWIALGWFMLGALLLGYRASTCEALSRRCRAHEDQPLLIWAFRLALLLLWLAFELN